MAVLPTRELAQQVHADFARLSMGRYASVCIFGGAPEGPQINAIRQGCHILVATPGRLLDLLERGVVTLGAVEAVVLDEADKLLEMGFREDIEKLLQQVKEQKDAESGQEAAGTKIEKSHQLLLFTATFPKWAKGIAETFMNKDRAFVDGTAYQQKQGEKEKEGSADIAGGTGCGTGLIEHLALQCHWKGRIDALPLVLSLYCARAAAAEKAAGGAAAGGDEALCVIFCETKQEVNEVALNSAISNMACALHGDIPQQQREATLKSFKQGKFKCLVATDVAARGLDISGIRLVVQMSPPRDVDTYIHRAGRTGRAGRKGLALLFYGKGDADFLVQIEKEGAFQFVRVGFPQGELVRSQRLLSTAKEVFPSVKLPAISDLATAGAAEGEQLLQTVAKKVLKKQEPQDVVVELLRRLLKDDAASGSADAPKLSALTGRPGFAAYVLTFNTAPSPPLQRSCAYVWRALKNKFTSVETAALMEKLEYMTLTADGCGAVFEVPETEAAAWHEHVMEPLDTTVDARGRKAGFTLRKAAELPQLQDALYIARQEAEQNPQEDPRSRQAARYNPNHVSSRRGGRGGAQGGTGRGGSSNGFDRFSSRGGRGGSLAVNSGRGGFGQSRRLLNGGSGGPAKRQRVT